MIIFWKKVVRSFGFAGEGIVSSSLERNMRVHLLATAIVIPLSVWAGISRTEWFTLIILIGLVISAEMVNTAVEELANLLRDELKLSYVATKRARDIAAGAVLVMAFVALIVGTSILTPRILDKVSPPQIPSLSTMQY